MIEDTDPPEGFDPDAAPERMLELAEPWTEIAELLELQELVVKMDHWLAGGCGALPLNWQPDPGVIMVRVMSNQPRRTSRSERRRDITGPKGKD